MSFNESWNFLLKRAYEVSKKNSFVDFKTCLKNLDNPQKKFKSIHIAGTNGKGSCGAILSEIFMASGYKVGVYSSPHILCPTERIRINGKAISKQKFEKYLGLISATEKRNNNSLSYFEILTAMAFQIFADEQVDIAIIETGIGGKKDITNIIKPAFCLITSIGLDHNKTLGNTIEKVAMQKAGIIKKGVPVAFGKIESKPLKIIKKVAVDKGAKIFSYENILASKNLKLNTINPAQKINANICYKVAKFFDIGDKIILSSIKKTKIPARMQVVKQDNATFIIDGAHNIEAIKNCLTSLPKKENMVLVVSLMADKNCQKIVQQISKHGGDIIFTEVKNSRTETAKNLAKFIDIKSPKKIIACKNVATAMACAEPYKYRVFLGSFYLASKVLDELKYKI
ncbi:MAG: hypothetical protein HOF38_02535 [Elusimicrobiaceae bacterium]|nr:hypothetical protein [Elusimicrobiaceae bacterium]MBT3955020.1 hypothetical protein [Elusimicrobiaceae bacterium]MBT4008088.1 hypothetical protein [Elusimicrobiaceae bacterium]MBT4440000.1 hypothetical protein [Elusimicrobiaceae bacterium]MBT6715833.1 hypothetical protein [Elusimicrobiaceae bacterium]